MNERLGYAEWEPQPEVSRKYRYNFQNFWLGRADNGASIGYGDDRHICLVSGNRGGKGTSIIVNNLCCWPGSAVVIDPKGENATLTAARRGRGNPFFCDGMGQAVHVLDPFKASQLGECYRSCFNPLDALDPNNEESIDGASRLANSLVVVKDDTREPFFDETARAMLRALILHVLTGPEFNPEDRTLLTVRDLMKRGDWQTAQIMAAAGDTDIEPPQILLWRSVQNNSAFEGILSGDGAMFLNMASDSVKTYNSVLQSALNNTDFIDSPGMRRVLAKSDFRLSELKTLPIGMPGSVCEDRAGRIPN